MTKPSQRRAVRHDQAGCMWGLISILDFRHGTRPTRKLLAARRRGSRQTLGENLPTVWKYFRKMIALPVCSIIIL